MARTSGEGDELDDLLLETDTIDERLLDDSWVRGEGAINTDAVPFSTTTQRQLSSDAIKQIVKPPENNFHKNEYGSEIVCTKCSGIDACANDTKLKLSFVFIGAALRFAWNCIYLSEAYFQTILGPSVLGRLGLTEDTATLGGMLLFLALRLRFKYRPTLLVTFSYMAVLCIFLALVVLITGGISSILLYALVGMNGLATGIAQAQAGALTGLFSGASVDSFVLIGTASASLGPTILQLATLSFVQSKKTVSAVKSAHKLQLYIVMAVGAVGLIGGLVSAMVVTGTAYFKKASKAERKRLLTLDKRVGKAKITGRFMIIWVHLLSIVGNWIISIFLSSITPFIPAAAPHDRGASMFWKLNLPVILIAAMNFGYFFGNLSIRYFNRFKCLSGDAFLFTAAILRIAFVPFVLHYSHQPFWLIPSSSEFITNLVIILVFFFIAFTGGGLTNLTSGRSQNLCGFGDAHHCPIVGALFQLSLQIGVLGGAGVSLLKS